MSRHQYILWRDDMPKNEQGMRFANVLILVGYTQETVAAYLKLADEMRETFPTATNDQMVCSIVRESDRVKNFTLLSYNHYVPEGEYPGWTQTNDPHYRWW
jgi:hypothetical protein